MLNIEPITYYNLNLTNDKTGPIPLIFDQNNMTDIIEQSKRYNVGVVRFSIPTNRIPTNIINYDNNTFKTNYIVSLSIENTLFTHSENVVFVPDSPDLQPSAPEYNWFYDLIEFVDIVNEAIKTSYNLCLIDDPTLPTNPPFINYNYVTKLYELYVPKDALDRPNYINVYFNELLNPLFLIPSINYIDPILTHKLIIKNRYVNLDLLQNYYIMSSDVEVHRNPNFQKLILVSNYGLHISNEFIQSPPNTINPNNSYSSVLTDFEPDKDQNNSAWLQFQSSGIGNVRLIDFKSNQSIQNFQIQVFWQDSQNTIYPLYIDPKLTASIKLAFIPKSYFVNNTYYGN